MGLPRMRSRSSNVVWIDRAPSVGNKSPNIWVKGTENYTRETSEAATTAYICQERERDLICGHTKIYWYSSVRRTTASWLRTARGGQVRLEGSKGRVRERRSPSRPVPALRRTKRRSSGAPAGFRAARRRRCRNGPHLQRRPEERRKEVRVAAGTPPNTPPIGRL